MMAGMPATLDQLAWPRRTARLAIRRPVAGDDAATWVFRRLPEVSWWLSGTPPTFAGYAAKFAEPERLARTLIVEREGAVIGDLYFAIQDGWAQAEVADQASGVQAAIGWVLSPAAQGHGYATEAVEDLLVMAFADLGLRRVFAESFAANESSWRLMERVGMRREQLSRQESLHHTGQWLDGVMYALLADEWAARRSQASGHAVP